LDSRSAPSKMKTIVKIYKLFQTFLTNEEPSPFKTPS
jgi:hypothetical protein